MYVPFLDNTFVRFWGGGYGVTTPISGRKSMVSFVGLFHPYIISKVYVISPRLILLDFGGLLSRVSFLTGTRGPVAPIAHRFRDVWHLRTSQTASGRSGDSDDQNGRTCVFVCFRAVQWRMVYFRVGVGMQGIF